MGRIAATGAIIVIAALALLWWLTAPQPMSAGDLPDYRPDADRGQRIFWAGGCSSCHAGPVDGQRARGDDRLLLGGGLELETPYGVFRVPNISPHADDGIGRWSMIEFVNAVQRGVSPRGSHYYPSFPYTSYAKMPVTDVMDLKAFLDGLPAVSGRVAAHSLRFPWSVRRGIGAWKRRYLRSAAIVRTRSAEPLIERGRQLVEGPGHCGECHTPRDRCGGLLTKRWLAGVPNPDGRGRIPNITPAGKDISTWSANDISYYLESGFTPEFDTVGGSMVAVQESLAMLPAIDRDAIAAYLKSVPPLN
jgi:mono/diheme cytochrome c family protein